MIFAQYVLGVVLGYIVYSLAGSVANLILGPLMGYRFASISFLGFMLARQNGKLKWKDTNFSIVPTVLLESKVTHRGKKVVLELGTILIGVAMCMCLLKLVVPYQSVFYAGIWEKTAWIAGVILVFHLLFFLDLLVKMFGNGRGSVIWREKDRVKNLLHDGVRPRRISFKDEELSIDCFGKDVTHRDYDLFRYYNALDLKDTHKLEELIHKMQACVEGQWNESLVPLFYELIYYHCAVETQPAIAEGYAGYMMQIMKKDEDANGKRVYASYLYYTGKDKNLALRVAKEGLQVAERFQIRGLVGMEKELLSELVQKIEGDLYERNFE